MGMGISIVADKPKIEQQIRQQNRKTKNLTAISETPPQFKKMQYRNHSNKTKTTANSEKQHHSLYIERVGA